MSYADEMAKLFRERDNKKTLPPQIGIVKSVTPLKISLLDGQILLDNDDVLICHALKEGNKANADIKIGDTTNSAEITFKNVLNAGDAVLCVESGNKFIIIDKVEVV